VSTQYTGSVWVGKRLEPSYPRKPPERVERIIDEVCARRGLSRSQMLGKRRTDKVSRARFEAAWLMRRLTFAHGRPPSYPQIALWLGRTDPTTAMHMVRRHAELTGAK
jgi:chromosomal replication initiation ATPase DnaA